MSHFYQYINGKIKTRHDLTVSQIRKENLQDTTFASVTTKLGSVKEGMLQKWIVKNVAKVSMDVYRHDFETDEEYIDYIVEHSDDIMNNAAKLGTAVHNDNEAFNLNPETHVSSPELTDITCWWHEYFHNNIKEVIGVEMMVGDTTLRVAGSLDLVAINNQDRWCLYDYKTRMPKKRPIKSNPDRKLVEFHDKDLRQLAIEALIIRNDFNLDYIPDIVSIGLHADGSGLTEKKWTDEQKMRGINEFISINFMYNCLEELDTLENMLLKYPNIRI